MFETDDPRILLKSRNAADRIRGAKMVRANPDKRPVRALSDEYVPLLSGCLSFPDEDVRLWSVRALATLDDRVIPILRRARMREASSEVNREIDAILNRNKPPAPVITAKDCTKKNRKKMLEWPVRELCDPIGHYPPILFSLGDGTHIYEGRARGEACFRGKRKKRCYKRCLPGGSRIATPSGPVDVRGLHEGDLVWSFDSSGARVAQPVRAVSSSIAGTGHRTVEVALSDGRVVRASGGHPSASGQLDDLEVGSHLDGATVRSIRNVPLEGKRTYDLLPAGETGLYIADGVILGSTIELGITPRERFAP